MFTHFFASAIKFLELHGSSSDFLVDLILLRSFLLLKSLFLYAALNLLFFRAFGSIIVHLVTNFLLDFFKMGLPNKLGERINLLLVE